MLIRKEDMDAQVVQKVLSGLQTSMMKPNPSGDELRMRQVQAQRMQPSLGGMTPWMLGGCGLGAAVWAFMLTGGASWGILLTVAFLLAFGVFTAGLLSMARTSQRKLGVMHSDLLAGWLPYIELTRTERAYCETLVLLGKPDLQVDEGTAKSILTQLNELMDQDRSLAAQREALVGLTTSSSVMAIEQDRDRIASQLAGTTDPHARGSLEQSLRLCEGRMANAQALTPTLERLDAQQEMIIQTLGSVQSNLARMESAHQALSPPEVDEIREQIQRLSAEAKAAESAVEEVLRV